MTYDLALYPAAGPGLGHLMRCYALAEAAVEMKAKVVVVLEGPTPAIAWPCAVVLGEDEVVKSARAVTDGRAKFGNQILGGPGVWLILDTPIEPVRYEVGGYIYPHFGAVPIPGFPTFVGPSWMPLRREFRVGRKPGEAAAWGTLLYKAGPEVERAESGKCVGVPENGTADAADLMRECYRAVVPPSTIAYEALAMGLDVELLHVAFPGCEQIGKAMVDAGVASWYGEGDAVTFKSGIDGRGAIRLLEALL